MTSSGNNDAAMQPSIAVGTEEQEGDFLSTMKTFDFAIIDDDDPELDLPSQVTNPPNFIAPSDVQPQVLRPSSQQPTVETLQSLGIKVRDFAYESTLPPIAPIPRVPRQTQPSARPLKRTRGDWEEEDRMPSQSSRPPFGCEATNAGMQANSKPESLVRKATEPLEFSPPPVSKRAMGCADLSRPVLFGNRLPFRTPRRVLKAHHTPPRRSSATPLTSPLFGSPSEEPSQGASQESELVVTPAGLASWDIEDTSSIPVSQMDTDLLAFVPEEISYSQLGLSTQSSQLATSLSTSMRSPVTPSHVSSQAVDTFGSSHLIPQIPNSRREPKRGMKASTTKISTQTSPRYLLRRRSLLSVHAPTRSRYPHPLTPTKKGSPKASPQPRCRRLQRPVLSR
ncbi:hypothetical protein DFJ58DRAFT_722028 [Suillus subalutaceus]|uniref:uncharacterized protein n=1 Tax=Suillus subalutaceus TaxID=48586 RepID=UPI001B85C097|nr:uncharacterized protein DFJ58DRAFT_722028 [Suillus subalutaceus]KAG1873762.1 hypothetical protein DFJ58DRAFT_722028 [Suillus subalutaceus]